MTEPDHGKIAEAIHAVHERSDGDFGGVTYQVARHRYPDRWLHEIDLSGVSDDNRHAAAMAAIEELAARGYVVSSVRFGAQRLHVERAEAVSSGALTGATTGGETDK